MPNPYPSALRTRAVDAYEAGEGSYVAIAEQFSISVSSLLRWVQRTRATGDVTALPKRGGWHWPVQGVTLTAVIAERADATAEEIRRAHNRRVPRGGRVSRSSIVRAVRRAWSLPTSGAADQARQQHQGDSSRQFAHHFGCPLKESLNTLAPRRFNNVLLFHRVLWVFHAPGVPRARRPEPVSRLRPWRHRCSRGSS